jgi:hypothetical protein
MFICLPFAVLPAPRSVFAEAREDEMATVFKWEMNSISYTVSNYTIVVCSLLLDEGNFRCGVRYEQ